MKNPHPRRARHLLLSLAVLSANCGGGGGGGVDDAFASWAGNSNDTLIVDASGEFFQVRSADRAVVDRNSGSTLTGLTVVGSSMRQNGQTIGSVVGRPGTAGGQVAAFQCTNGQYMDIVQTATSYRIDGCSTNAGGAGTGGTGSAGGTGTGGTGTGTGGTGSGGTGGSSTNASLNTNATQCLSLTDMKRGDRCGDPTSLSFKITNTCSTPVYVHYCLERIGGKLSCGAVSYPPMPPGGSTTGSWTCSATGRYKVWGCTALGSGNCGGDPTSF